jgi:hypothetical protein
MLVLALGAGLAITGLPIAISAAFDLEPLYLCALVLACTFIAGKSIGLSKKKLAAPRAPPMPPLDSEREIKSMLQKRGFSGLVKKGRKKGKRD